MREATIQLFAGPTNGMSRPRAAIAVILDHGPMYRTGP